MNRHFEDTRYYLKRAGETAKEGITAELAPLRERIQTWRRGDTEQEPDRIETVRNQFTEVQREAIETARKRLNERRDPAES